MRVIVKATKKELHEVGICSDRIFKWLMDGQPKEVSEESHNAYGRRMLYLKHPDDTDWCKWWGWVWEDMVEIIEEDPQPVYKQAQHLTMVLNDDDKVGVEPHLPGGIRALNEALGLPKFHHRDDGGQLGLVKGDRLEDEECSTVSGGKDLQS